jgi:lipopolysaccharide export system protein LptC
MTSIARTDTIEQRDAIYASLIRRNRIVAILRVWLPAMGLILFLALVLQFFLGSITTNLGFANVSIDRDNLVVEAPNYSGIGAGGAAYTVKAGSARAAINNTDLIHLTDATFEMIEPNGSSFAAAAESSQVEVSAQIVTVDGVMSVSGSNGLEGTVTTARIDLIAEQMVGKGATDLRFSSGTRVKSDSMTFDSKAGIWTFKRATVTVPMMPGSSEGNSPLLDGLP